MATKKYKMVHSWTREDVLKLLLADLNQRGLSLTGEVQFVLGYRSFDGARFIEEAD